VTITRPRLLADGNRRAPSSHNVSTTAGLDDLSRPARPVRAAGKLSAIRQSTLRSFSLCLARYRDPNVNLKVQRSPANTASFRIDGPGFANNGYWAPADRAQEPISVDANPVVTVPRPVLTRAESARSRRASSPTRESATNLSTDRLRHFANEDLNAGTPLHQQR